MSQQNNVPQLYQLAGEGISITYTIDNGNMQPQLTYQNGSAQDGRTFTGKLITQTQSPLGLLVTVLLNPFDSDSMALTLVVPGINLAETTQQNINTFAVVTTNLFSIGQMHTPRQTQVYHIYQLQGTASV